MTVPATTPQFDASVPAHLRLPAFLTLNQQAIAGINTFTAPHRISIRGGRFRLVDPEGNEQDVVENNGTAVEVAIVGANPSLSRTYFDKPYDPARKELVAPACWSDNGVGPSSQAASPQHATCAGCPNDAWGSKINQQTGKPSRACSNFKKLAVIPVSNVAGFIYQLNVPPDSLKALAAIVKLLEDRGVPLAAMVVKLSFDTSVSHPKLVFTPARWLSEAEAHAIKEHLGSDEVAEIVGADDKPRVAGIAVVEPGNSLRPMPEAAPPVVPFPPPPTPVQQPAPPPAAALADAPRRRGRRTNAEIAAEAAAQQPAPPPPAAAAPEVPAFLVPPAAGPTPVPAAPVQAASSDLDALLDGIMGAK